jgi:hypothetical protein
MYDSVFSIRLVGIIAGPHSVRLQAVQELWHLESG